MQPLNRSMIPRQPSACGLCGFPGHLHDGTFRVIVTGRLQAVVCARYRFPDQELILRRMLERRRWTPWERWTVGRSQDR